MFEPSRILYGMSVYVYSKRGYRTKACYNRNGINDMIKLSNKINNQIYASGGIFVAEI